jgi:dsDNA-specific endonuclease/ATPase MutS2
MMRSYMALIEDSLAKAEARSKEIGRFISTQAQTAAGLLEKEIAKLEHSSEAHVVKAAKALREQQERIAAQMAEMLADTAGGFQQTAQDMRVTAQQVVKDIEGARGELKRAILDLPEETRVNADNMRRVVTDQIAALNALADVVKRQGGTLDISMPGNHLAASRYGGDGGAGKR